MKIDGDSFNSRSNIPQINFFFALMNRSQLQWINVCSLCFINSIGIALDANLAVRSLAFNIEYFKCSSNLFSFFDS